MRAAGRARRPWRTPTLTLPGMPSWRRRWRRVWEARAVTAPLRAVTGAEDLHRAGPLERFEALLARPDVAGMATRRAGRLRPG